MAKFIIEGGSKLSGTIDISGNKNSVLPCIAAALLTKETVTLKNVPNIVDVDVFVNILHALGVEANFENHTLVIKAENIKSSALPENLTGKLRASILLTGPLLVRTGETEFTHPGGDIIGKRSIETHIEGFKLLGYTVERNDRSYKVKRNETQPTKEIFLNEASVTATENLLLTSAVGNTPIIFKNCAKEPHVVDLCNLLVQMGVRIEGIGESTLTVHPEESLKGAEFTIGPDFVEFGTYAIAAALTGGEITMNNFPSDGMEPIINPLQVMGINFQKNENSITCSSSEIKAIARLHTNIWPGFPTDMMSVVIVLATQAKGVSLLHDWMYESRMFFVDKLIMMGAQITIADPHRVIVSGAPSKLMARDLETPDIRAGMALVLASLIAQGKSTINKAELIERGYEDVVNKLKSLGANIERVE